MVKKAQAKRQRAVDYGNIASKASSREGDLKELKKQVGGGRWEVGGEGGQGGSAVYNVTYNGMEKA